MGVDARRGFQPDEIDGPMVREFRDGPGVVHQQDRVRRKLHVGPFSGRSDFPGEFKILIVWKRGVRGDHGHRDAGAHQRWNSREAERATVTEPGDQNRGLIPERRVGERAWKFENVRDQADANGEQTHATQTVASEREDANAERKRLRKGNPRVLDPDLGFLQPR